MTSPDAVTADVPALDVPALDVPTLDVPTAEQILRRAHPAAVVTEVVRRTGGEISLVCEVRCEDPAHSAIFKIYEDRWRWKQRKEQFVYRLIADRTSWPVPEVLHTDPNGGPGGRAVTVLSLLEGQPMSEASDDFDVDQDAEIYRQMGAALADLHQIGQEAYGFLVTKILDPLLDNGSYMRRQFGKRLKEFQDLGGDESLYAAAVAKVQRQGSLFEGCKAPVLCHNDLHEGNVLVAQGPAGWRITGLIDVENAAAADPLFDLAKTDYYSLGRGDRERAALLEGYGELPDDAAERIALYRLYHALELWDWFRSIEASEKLVGIAAEITRLVE